MLLPSSRTGHDNAPDTVATAPNFSVLVTKTQKLSGQIGNQNDSLHPNFGLYVLCNQIKLQNWGSKTQVTGQVRSVAFSHVLRG